MKGISAKRLRIAPAGLVLAAAGLSACATMDSEYGVGTLCSLPELEVGHPAAHKDPDFPGYRADLTHTVPTVGFQVCDSTAADLNGDGRAEFLAADHLEPGFGYFTNDASASSHRVFEDGVRVAFGSGGGNSAGIVTADYNRDGRPDVANSNHPGSVTVRINGTPPGGAAKVRFPRAGETDRDLGVDYGRGIGIAGQEGGLVSADFDGDGRVDIATADLGKTKRPEAGRSPDCPGGDPNARRFTVSVLLNTTADEGAAQASFGPIHYFPIPGPAISIASADFNFDGRPDLVTADTGKPSSVSILTNETRPGAGAPCFSAAQSLPIDKHGLPQGAGPTNPLAVDLNGDDRPDIASANWNTRTVNVWINTTPPGGAARPTFSRPLEISTGGVHPLVLRAHDLDGDGLRDLVVLPLSTQSNVAMLVIRNESRAGSSSPAFVVDAVYSIPKELENRWLYTYFSSAGVVHDFDGDGLLDIGVVVARGSLLLKAMKPGNDVLSFVDPGVPLWVVHPILPHHSMLVVYRRESASPAPPACADAPAIQTEGFCATARALLEELPGSVADMGEMHAEQGHADHVVRSKQSDHAAERLRELAAAAPPEIRADLELVAAYVEDASERLHEESSWHVHHDVDTATDRVTAYLHETCGDPALQAAR